MIDTGALLAGLEGAKTCPACDRELGERPVRFQQRAGAEWLCAPCAAMVEEFEALWRLRAFEAWLKGGQVFSIPAK